MEEAERIARGLSAAQRRTILSGRQPDGAGKWPLRNTLIDKGLATDWPWSITPLGQQVRAILLRDQR